MKILRKTRKIINFLGGFAIRRDQKGHGYVK